MLGFDNRLLRRIEEKTGFAVSSGRFSGNLWRGLFAASQLVVKNPAHYPEAEFLHFESIECEASLAGLVGREIRLRRLHLHLRKLTGLRAPCGTVNIEEFRNRLEGENRESLHARFKEKNDWMRRLRVGGLLVKVDCIATGDFSNGNAVWREYGVRIEREFRDVDDIRLPARTLAADLESAGLSRHSDPIFATLLPAVLWAEISRAQQA